MRRLCTWLASGAPPASLPLRGRALPARSGRQGEVTRVGDRELVDGHRADRGDDVVETVIQRPVTDGRAELGVVRAAERGEPGPVVSLVPEREQGLALGYAQRVGRDPGVERQARIRDDRLGAEELADGADQAGTARFVMRRARRAGGGLIKGVRYGKWLGVAQGQQDVVFLLADAAAEHRQLDRGLGV